MKTPGIAVCLTWLIATAAITRAEDSAIADETAAAKADIERIVKALKAYQLEYGVLPSTFERAETASGPTKYTTVGDPKLGASVHNSALFNILRDLDATSNAHHNNNPRQHRFIEGPSVVDPAMPRAGFVDSDLAAPILKGCMMDPWGREYFIRLDYDKSGTVQSPGGEVVKEAVLVWSIGPDGKPGTADDLFSWR